MQRIWESCHFKETYSVNTTPFELKNSSLRVQTFCHSVSRKNWQHAIDPVRRSVIAFFILSGKQEIVGADKKRQPLLSGCFGIVDLEQFDAQVVTVTEKAVRYFILFEKNQLLSSVLKEMFPAGLPVFVSREPEKIIKCFEEIRREISRRCPSDGAVGAAAYQLLYEAARQLPVEELPAALVQAKAYIADHLHQKHLCREEVAAASCVSISSLALLFKKHLGISVGAYIQKLRIEKVCQLLTFSNKSIAEIALESGFSYSYYLAREFRKSKGMTPSAYRKKSRKTTALSQKEQEL